MDFSLGFSDNVSNLLVLDRFTLRKDASCYNSKVMIYNPLHYSEVFLPIQCKTKAYNVHKLCHTF